MFSWQCSCQWLLGYDSKSTGNKSKGGQVGLHQTKEPLQRKKTIKEWKTTYRMQENIRNYASDKRLTSKIYKELQLNSSKKYF